MLLIRIKREGTTYLAIAFHQSASAKNGIDSSGNADLYGLPWRGSDKESAVSQGIHALRCSQTLLKEPDEKLYLMADSSDLVNYFAVSLQNSSLSSEVNGGLGLETVQWLKSLNIVAREMSEENLHLDKQSGRNASQYYASFVDLLIGSQARCLAYGLGRYGLFAAKLAGTRCQLWYQKESNATLILGKGHNVPYCAKIANGIDILYPTDSKALAD